MKKFHEVANIFPLLDDNDLQALADDIKQNGLLEPIWLHPDDGSIIDGRNRYRACKIAGVEPRYRTWDGSGSLVAFVVSLNLTRRHLTTSQRAALAIDVLPMLEKDAKDRLIKSGKKTGRGNKKVPQKIAEPFEESRVTAAAMFNTNRQYVSDAKKLANEAPDLFQDVKQGKTSIGYAKRKLGKRKAEKRRAKEKEAPKPIKRANVHLHVGDAGNLCMISAETIDIIITSPPYNLGADAWPMGGNGRYERDNGIGYSDNLSQDQYERWQLDVLKELYRVAKPGASLFYNHKARTQDGKLIHPFSWLSLADGWTLRQEIIWDREVTHNHSKTIFWPTDERIYWLTKGKPTIYAPSVGMPAVWRFHGPAPHTWHPAPFVAELPRRCFRAIGGESLTVLDPFAGSCQTAVAALEAGHQAIMVDINEDYLLEAKHQNEWQLLSKNTFKHVG